MNSTRSLVANFQINSYEITVAASSVAGGTVTGGGTYNYGETATIVATTNTGYHFINWTENGNEVSTNPIYNVIVISSHSYVAHFQINTYEITVTANPEEGGTITGAGTYNYGETVTLTATSNAGYTFQNWTENGQTVSSNQTYIFIVNSSRSLVANFNLNSYEITVVASPVAGGTVTGGGTYNYGETATIVATTNIGYHFINWTENGNEVSMEQTYSLTVTSLHDFVANFNLNSYVITVSANPIAGGKVTGGGTYNYGITATLTANTNIGYLFNSWTENGQIVSTNAVYSFTVTSNCSLVANFSLNSYVITVSANPVTGGTVTGGGTYNYGTTVTLTATANTGYSFTQWTEDGQMISIESVYTLIVTEAHDIIAWFTLNSYEISADINLDNSGTVSGTGVYNYGATATLVAVANEGYTFKNWTENGSVVSTNNTYSFIVYSSRLLTANFEINTYHVNVIIKPDTCGTVTGAGNYNYGETVVVTATAFDRFRFIGWTIDGDTVSHSLEYSFVITSDIDITANFSDFSGIDDQETSVNVVIYPNPAIDNINIKFDANYSSDAILYIYRMDDGKLCGSSKDLSSSFTLDISEYAAGIYIIKIVDSGRMIVKKFVKQVK